jgi:hypothetical protein
MSLFPVSRLDANMDTVELWLAFDNTYRHGLTIPLGTCMRFATFPLSWLSYLGVYTLWVGRATSPTHLMGQRSHIVIPAGIYYYIARVSHILVSLDSFM